MGAPNIAEFLPPNSFIDASKFKTPKKLAKYMKTILSDPDLYNSYHVWRHTDPKTWNVLYQRKQLFTPCTALKHALLAATNGTCQWK